MSSFLSISKREKFLLSILLLILLSWGYIYYIAQPQMNTIRDLKDERALLEMQLQANNNLLLNRASINESLSKLQGEFLHNKGQYFSYANQDEIVLNIIEFLNEGQNISIADLNFIRPTEVAIEEINYLEHRIRVSFSGSYEKVLAFFDAVWNFEKSIIIDNLTLNKENENNLDGTLELVIYDIYPLTEERENLYEWLRDYIYKKENPFTIYDNNGIDRRYAFLGSSIKTYTDIEEHWAKEYISSFGVMGYLKGFVNDVFNPDIAITRGEFMLLLDNILQWPAEDNVDLTAFEDHQDFGMYSASISRAFAKGYIHGAIIGYEDRTLRPYTPITYREVELVMERVLKTSSFKWEEVATRLQAEAGFTSPGSQNKGGNISKAEAVYLFHYLLQENQI